MTRLKMFNCRRIKEPETAVVIAMFIQAIADLQSRSELIQKDAKQWLIGPGAAKWLDLLDINPIAAVERFK